MKIIIIGIAILSGFLYNELKDFFFTGGMENKLALILLKIFIISLLILLLFILGMSNLEIKNIDPINSIDSTNISETTNSFGDQNGNRRKRSMSIRRNKFNSNLSYVTD